MAGRAYNSVVDVAAQHGGVLAEAAAPEFQRDQLPAARLHNSSAGPALPMRLCPWSCSAKRQHGSMLLRSFAAGESICCPV